MKYGKILPGVFLARPNRFIAHVETAGRMEICHVKNTGRCRELLVPGARVWLEESANPARKTRYDLIAVEKMRPDGPLFINMDAQAPNKVFGEWAAAGGLGFVPTLLRPETAYGSSRFDFYWEFSETPGIQTDVSRETPCRRGFIEVKGCTLEEDGLALFPDAPTLRGVKHLRELTACRKAGYEAAVCFVIQMAGMEAFSPNSRTHSEFAAALRDAAEAGVRVLAVECAAAPDSLRMTNPVPVRL